MSRKAAVVFALLAVLLGLALIPWTVRSDRVAAAVSRQILREYGYALSVSGATTISLLPLPRIELMGAKLADPSGALAVDADQMRGTIRLWPMFLGRIRLADLRIMSARISLDPTALARQFRTRFGPGGAFRDPAALGSPIGRLVVTNSDVTLTEAGRSGAQRTVTAASAVLRWPNPTADLDITAAGTWNGVAGQLSLVGLSPAALLSGERDSISLTIATELGQTSLVGDVSLAAAQPRFSGIFNLSTGSIGDALRWTGFAPELNDVRREASLSGECRLDVSGAEWPAVQLSVGSDRLDGTFALKLNGPRPQVLATLASTDLDLGWVVPLLDPGRATVPSTDYDVRLSASNLAIGPLRLGDLASAVLIRGDRMELSLGRANLAGGVVRGRAATAIDHGIRDLRIQLAADRIDANRLLVETGLPRAVAGSVSLQANLASSGAGEASLARSLRGRLAVTAQDGEIAGLSLGVPPPPRQGIAQETRGGRTRFANARMALAIEDGTGDLQEGQLDTPSGQSISLSGRVSLDDGYALAATLRGPAADGGRPTKLDVRGPFDRPTVTALETPEAASPAPPR